MSLYIVVFLYLRTLSYWKKESDATCRERRPAVVCELTRQSRKLTIKEVSAILYIFGDLNGILNKSNLCTNREKCHGKR